MSNELTDKSPSLLANELLARSVAFIDCLKLCRKKPSRKNVHSLRISCRQLLAICEACRNGYAARSVKRLRRQVRFCMEELGSLRDTQVTSRLVKEQLPNSKQKRFLLKKLASAQRKGRRRVPDVVASVQLKKVRNRAKRIHYSLWKRTCRTGAQRVEHNATVTVEHAMTQFFENYRKLDLTNDEALHNFRVSTKKLRYLVELLAPIIKLPPSCPSQNTLVALQRLTGNLRDIVLVKGIVKRHIKKAAPRDRVLAALFDSERAVLNHLQVFLLTLPWAPQESTAQSRGTPFTALPPRQIHQ